MIVLLLILGLFAVWSLIGLAVLAAVRADLTSLRVALTAPVVGTAATALALFLVSHAGVGMSTGARPVVISLLVLSVTVLGARRPRLPWTILPVLGISVAGVLLAAWPVFRFGFHWLAEGNDDMANYVLSATYLLHHGLLAPIDYVGLSHDRDYASVLASLHRSGSRPGADITLSALSGVTGQLPQNMFMPLIYSLGMSTACGTAALAMQASRRWWAASVAAIFVVVSPQATYGIIVQLMPQVWGLGIATALFALLMRRELYSGVGARIRDVVPIALLVAALVLVYVELASAVALAYVLYVAILAVRRELDLRVAGRLWVPAVAFTAIVLNEYLVRELRYVGSQASVGIHGIFNGPPNWGYTLVPSALPGVLGFYPIPVSSIAPHLQAEIVLAAIMLVGVLVGIVVTAWRGVAASIVLLAFAGLGVYLGVVSSDFGLFKLYMYVQPFLAAVVAVWLAGARRRWTPAIVALPLILLVWVQISAQQKYVRASLNPLALRDASAASLLPTFRRLLRDDPKPIISVTENPALTKLEAASADDRPLYFMSQFVFGPRDSKAAHLNGWAPRSFELLRSPTKRDRFWENTHASSVLASGRCTIVLPAGTQIVVNRSSLPARKGLDIVGESCAAVHNMLVFTASSRGWGFFYFTDRKTVSFYPPENDAFFKGQTFAAFGQRALFRVLNATARVRLELSLSTTLLRKPLPPASVIGSRPVNLPLSGNGSARVFSVPLRVQRIAGQPYVLLDLGRAGSLFKDSRPGLAGLYGRAVPLDPRYLTAFVRNVSLVSDARYRHLKRPLAVSGFPKGLEDPNLEYSGIDETGLVASDSYAVLSRGKAADLLLRAGVFPAPRGQRLRVFINGKELLSRRIESGELTLRVPVPASDIPRRIELRWRFAPALPAPDGRKAAAALTYLGLVPR
jgi:hypothetical protein